MSSPRLRLSTALVSLVLPAALGLVGCATDATNEALPEDDALVSSTSNLSTMRVEAELEGESGVDNAVLIRRQLLYLVGQLNGEQGGGAANVGSAPVKVLSESSSGSGMKRLRYSTTLTLSISKQTPKKGTYSWAFPRNVSVAGLKAFKAKYARDCAEPGHNSGELDFFYDYRPSKPGCQLASADVTRGQSPLVAIPQANATYPEYDRVWEDNTLNIVTVSGRNAVGGGEQDYGTRQYRNYLRRWEGIARTSFKTTTLPNKGGTPAEKNELTMVFGAKSIRLVTYLVDLPQLGGAAFDSELKEGSKTADFVAYLGHAGLGVNTAAFLDRLSAPTTTYRLVLLDNCNSFAYPNFSTDGPPSSWNPPGVLQNVIVNANPGLFDDVGPDAIAWAVALAESKPRPFVDLLPKTLGNPMVLFDEKNTYKPR